MRFNKEIILTFLAVFSVSSCTEVQPSEQEIEAYSEEAAMAHFLTEPDRSLEILDSAVLIRNITPQRADYLRTIILFNGKGDAAAAEKLCQRLIDEEVWEDIPDGKDRVSFQVDVYRLMATIATDAGNHLSILRYCREGAALSHGVDILRGDEADFYSRMGYAMCQIGQTDEGLSAMARADSLAKSDATWSSLLSYLNNTKKMYHVLEEAGEYERGKQLVTDALSALEELKRDVSKVRFVPEGIACDSVALSEFADYYQVPFHCYLADACALLDQKDSTLLWLDRVKESAQSENPDLNSHMIYPLIYLGRYDEAQQLIAERKECLGDCSNEDYLSLLKYEMQIARHRGDYPSLCRLSEEALSVSDSLKFSQFNTMIADGALQYKIQEVEMRHLDEERRLMFIINILTLLTFLAVAFITWRYVRTVLAKHKELTQKYEDVQERLEELTEEVEEDASANSLEDLYHLAVTIMEEQELFKNPSCDIGFLSQMIPTNRSYLSAAINSVSGMNFRSWLAKYRIDHAKKVLMENDKITVDRLATECGFDNRTSLYRHFKNFEGMTPGEWVKLMRDKR